MRGEEDFGGQRTPFGIGKTTGLVREDNQVRLGATRYPMACLYTDETVLSIAREGNESSYH
jgi:hypothetical protein